MLVLFIESKWLFNIVTFSFYDGVLELKKGNMDVQVS